MSESEEYEEYESIDGLEIDKYKDYCDTNLGIFWGKVTETEIKFVEELKKRSKDCNKQIIDTKNGQNNGLNDKRLDPTNKISNDFNEPIDPIVSQPKQLKPNVSDLRSISKPIVNTIVEKIKHSFEDNDYQSMAKCCPQILNLKGFENQLTTDPKTQTLDSNDVIQNEINSSDINDSNIEVIKRLNEYKMFDNIPEEVIKKLDLIITNENIEASKRVEQMNKQMASQSKVSPSGTQSSGVSEESIGCQHFYRIGSQSLINGETESFSLEGKSVKIKTELIFVDSSDEESSDSSDIREYEKLFQDIDQRKDNLNDIQTSISSIRQSLDSNQNQIIGNELDFPPIGEQMAQQMAQPVNASQKEDTSLDSINTETLWTNSQEINFQELVEKYLNDPGFNPIGEGSVSQEFLDYP